MRESNTNSIVVLLGIRIRALLILVLLAFLSSPMVAHAQDQTAQISSLDGIKILEGAEPVSSYKGQDLYKSPVRIVLEQAGSLTVTWFRTKSVAEKQTTIVLDSSDSAETVKKQARSGQEITFDLQPGQIAVQQDAGGFIALGFTPAPAPEKPEQPAATEASSESDNATTTASSDPRIGIGAIAGYAFSTGNGQGFFPAIALRTRLFSAGKVSLELDALVGWREAADTEEFAHDSLGNLVQDWSYDSIPISIGALARFRLHEVISMYIGAGGAYAVTFLTHEVSTSDGLVVAPQTHETHHTGGWNANLGFGFDAGPGRVDLSGSYTSMVGAPDSFGIRPDVGGIVARAGYLIWF